MPLHIRTQIRRRIAEALAVLPNTVIHRSHTLRLDKEAYRDETHDSWINHCVVYTFGSSNAGAGGTLGGCYEIPYRLDVGVELCVAGLSSEDPEDELDALELIVLPIVTGNLDTNTLSLPKLDFVTENTTVSPPGSEFSEYIRRMAFTCDLLLDTHLPSEIQRL